MGLYSCVFKWNRKKKKSFSISTTDCTHKPVFMLFCRAWLEHFRFHSIAFIIWSFFFLLSVLDSLSLSSLFFSVSFRFSRHLLNIIIAHFSRSSLLYKKIKMKKKWKRKTCCKASACLNENLNILYAFFLFFSLFPNLLFYVSPWTDCVDGNLFIDFDLIVFSGWKVLMDFWIIRCCFL